MTSINRRDFLRGVGCAALGLTGSACVSATNRPWTQRAGEEKLNFVFILIDDLGWMDTGCYGSTFYETPNIDRLASEGVRFTDAYAACPVCSPTRASILTGKYPARLHLTDWIPGHRRTKAKLRVPEFNQELPLYQTTIAEALKPAGYASASLGKWHLGKSPFHPEHQGFDLNFAGYHRGQPPSYFQPYNIPNVPEGKDGEYLTDRTTDEALRFIEANRDRPFFVYLTHYAVHTPLQAKKNLIEKYEAKVEPGQAQNNPTYAGMIESVDESVGRVLDKLDELGIADRTVVFFMSDNGGLARVTSNAPLREGKGTLYEGGIREPMIIKWPRVAWPGALCHEPVTSVDFFPTICEMAGVNPEIRDIDGVSLVPLLTGKTSLKRDAIYWHYPHYHPCGATPGGIVRQGRFKLIEYYEDARLELYDLVDDIGEKHNLADVMPRKTAKLREMLHEWLEAAGAQMPTPNLDYEPPS